MLLKSWCSAPASLRLPEFCVCLALFILIISGSFGSPREPYIPQVQQLQNNSYVLIANNTEFSYPITLNGVLCSPTTLQLCKASALSLDDPCCHSLLATTSHTPFSTVSDQSLYMLTTLLPFALLLFRGIVAYYFHLLHATGTYLVECLLGVVSSAVLSSLIIDALKVWVGRPRPNYFALRLFASVYVSDRSTWQDIAITSFPSGHAGLSMTAMVFVALSFLKDSQTCESSFKISRMIRLVSLILITLAISCMLLALWVGATRIFDYWHSPADVAAGWAIGACVAAVVFYYGVDVGLNLSPNMPMTDTVLDDSYLLQGSTDQHEALLFNSTLSTERPRHTLL